MRRVFLDHQSSTPVLPEVIEAMKPFYAEAYGNPSSLHQLGVRARDAIEVARGQMAGLIGAESPEEIVFTSNGTEAANLAVKGAAWGNQRRGKHLIVSGIEHPAVLNSVAFLESQGFRCTRLAVDRNGFVAPDDVRGSLTEETILICVQHVNYDVGTIEPIRQIAEISNDRGILLFVDAGASAGWTALDVQALGVSLLSLTPHRFYGPKGIGVLYRNRRVRLVNLVHGGDQERGHRAGTENVPAIVGGGVAAEMAVRHLAERQGHTGRLQRQLWNELRTAVPGLSLNGPEPGPGRVSTNLNVSAEGIEGEGVLLSLDMAGVAVASGTSCVSKSMKPSPVLEAMGISRDQAKASVIFSLGQDNTAEEMDYAAAAFAKTVRKLRELSSHQEPMKARPQPAGVEAPNS